jgi:hypothetical protein
MFFVCPYCGKKKAVPVFIKDEIDKKIIKCRCLECQNMCAVMEIVYEKVTGVLDVKRIKFKLLPLPIPVYDERGNLVTYITKEDLDRQNQMYRSLFKVFGMTLLNVYDDEHVYYRRDYKIEYDGAYAALYCDGVRYASKRLF